MNWYVRAGGAEANGGGYDGTTYPGGLNFADQDAAQATLTTLSTVHTTTTQLNVSVADYTVTPNDVGNVVRITGGTGTAGYFVITTTDVGNNRWTVDRSLGTAAQTCPGRMGGAHHFPWVYANGGTGTQPALATPLLPGHTINIRGAGSDDPAAGSQDYDMTGGYWNFPAGDGTSGMIKLIGYNGRPEIKSHGLTFYQSSLWHYEKLKGVIKTSPSFTAFGFISHCTFSTLVNIIVDANGQDCQLIGFITASGSTLRDFELRNTGGGAAGTTAGLSFANYGCQIENGWIHALRGDGVNIQSASLNATIRNCIIANNGRYGVLMSETGSTFLGAAIFANTIDANGSDGIHVNDKDALNNANIRNNIISNHSGKYGIAVANGNAADNELFIRGRADYNNVYNNGTNYFNINAGAHDVSLNPSYSNAGGNNYAVGINMKAIGVPGVVGKSSTTSYVDIGAAQRQEAGGGGSFTFSQ